MSYLLKKLLTFYQVYISKLLGFRCRFYPSCSHYAEICLHKHHWSVACCRVLWRLLRCQPWNKGGYDFP